MIADYEGISLSLISASDRGNRLYITEIDGKVTGLDVGREAGKVGRLFANIGVQGKAYNKRETLEKVNELVIEKWPTFTQDQKEEMLKTLTHWHEVSLRKFDKKPTQEEQYRLSDAVIARLQGATETGTVHHQYGLVRVDLDELLRKVAQPYQLLFLHPGL